MHILERESGKSLTEPNSICSNLFAYLAILHLRFGWAVIHGKIYLLCQYLAGKYARASLTRVGN